MGLSPTHLLPVVRDRALVLTLGLGGLAPASDPANPAISHGREPAHHAAQIVGTIVPSSFIFGELRIATGSIGPASIGHPVHNVARGTLAGFALTSSPVVVEE